MARALTALTIGPLEATGRDGVAADLRTFAALGLHGTVIVTEHGGALLGADSVARDLERVFSSVKVDAVKLACPASPDLLLVIAGVLERNDVARLVLDPGHAAFEDDAREVLIERLLPLARVAVPNVLEAQALTSRVIDTWEDMREAAEAIGAMGAANVVIKGGKQQGERATDILFDGSDYRDYTAERVLSQAIPGAGTTFDAAVAATLAKGESVQHSVAAAKAYVTKALQSAYDLGGVGGLHHFYRYWQANAPER